MVRLRIRRSGWAEEGEQSEKLFSPTDLLLKASVMSQGTRTASEERQVRSRWMRFHEANGVSKTSSCQA
jgi:hypothetical protein